MGIIKKIKESGSLADVIRCDEPSYLIWKWHPSENHKDKNRSNAIRMGSSLRVKAGEVAVFVYHQKDGTMQDFVEGPFDKILLTANLPVLSTIIGLAYDGNTPFQAEVYFINLAKIIQVDFAVPFFDIFDPRFDDYSVPVAVRGTLTFNISDYHYFISLHRLIEFDLQSFQKQIRDAVTRRAKGVVANIPVEYEIPVIQIEKKIREINERIGQEVIPLLHEKFGVDVVSLDISDIEVDKTSENYVQLMSVTKDLTAKAEIARNEAVVKNIKDKQRVDMENYEESLEIQREISRYEQQMKIRSENLVAYQTEKQTEVGVAGANALGQMNSNGAGNINLGENGSGGGIGFNPAAVMTGMAMGGVVGQNIAGMMGNAFSGLNQTTPPPVNSKKYFVAIDNQQKGPFDLWKIQTMIHDGELLPSSLIWSEGMADWSMAGSVTEVNQYFGTEPPPLPNK